MDKLSTNEIDRLEAALTTFNRIIKKPSYWEEFQLRAGVNIDRPSAAIIYVLAKEDCQFQTLVNRLGLEAPSISRKVHELEQQGLIERKPSDDRRVHKLHLSHQAQAVYKQLSDAKRDILSETLQGWTAEERHQLIIIIEHLADDMKNRFETKGTN